MIQLITADQLAKGKGRRGVIYQLNEAGGGLYFWGGKTFHGYNQDGQKSSIGSVIADYKKTRRLPRWEAALAAVAAGTRNAKLAIVGDSVSAGMYANAGAGYANNNFASCWPYLLAPYFNSLGYAANTGSVFGDSTNTGLNATLNAHDTRRNVGGNWTQDGWYGLGGLVLRTLIAGNVSKYNFTPLEQFDTIKVFFAAFAGFGKIAISIDGGAALTTLSVNGGASNLSEVDQSAYSVGSVNYITVTVPLGFHTVNLFRAASDGGTGAVACTGLLTSNSTQRSIDIINTSVGGATTALASVTTAAYSSLTMLRDSIQPDLTIVCLDINDWALAVTPGTYDLTTAATHSEQLRKILIAAEVTGDTILVTGAPSAIGSFTRAAQDAILQATRNIANICGVPLVDVHAGWGDYVTATASGYFLPNADVVHPGVPGQADIAARVAGVLGIPELTVAA